MRVTVGAFNRASTGAISLGIPMSAMGWMARSCASCPAGAAHSDNARTSFSKFFVRKVGELSHTRLCRAYSAGVFGPGLPRSDALGSKTRLEQPRSGDRIDSRLPLRHRAMSSVKHFPFSFVFEFGPGILL